MTPSRESSGLAWGEQTLTLERYFADDSPNLRAWNAADEHLLKVLQDEETGPFRLPVWIFGDAFGGLTCAMAVAAGPKLSVGEDGTSSGAITHWSDSYLACQSARQNLERNGLPPDTVQWVGSTADPHRLRGSARTVLMQVPKSLALFEYMLEWMKPRISPSTRFLCAGMTKHLSPHVRSILRQRVGPTEISPVYKKSVVFTSFPEYLTTDEEALTPEWYTAPGSTARVFAFPGVFGGDRLDNGTRLLLANLPKVVSGQRVVDVGCGSGVIGLTVKQREPGAEVILIDESYLAIASARLTFHENGLRSSGLIVGDGAGRTRAGQHRLGGEQSTVSRRTRIECGRCDAAVRTGEECAEAGRHVRLSWCARRGLWPRAGACVRQRGTGGVGPAVHDLLLHAGPVAGRRPTTRGGGFGFESGTSDSATRWNLTEQGNLGRDGCSVRPDAQEIHSIGQRAASVVGPVPGQVVLAGRKARLSQTAYHTSPRV